MAVALNFTQTKMEMPVTKQSTISSFFLPQSKKGKGTVRQIIFLPVYLNAYLQQNYFLPLDADDRSSS